MTSMIEKLEYFLELSSKRLRGKYLSCPNCASSEYDPIDRKFIVSALHRCRNCRLLYRVPGDDVVDSEAFYQDSYEQGFTTEMPSPARLQELIVTNFNNTEKFFGPRIDVLEALHISSGQHIFDFGCSWGYGSWQLMQAGYHVAAFEISRPRAQYAKEHLGVSLISQMPASRADAGELAGSFDCFFSSHVIEHIPQPSKAFEYARILLKPGGLFVAFTPNGSLAWRAENPRAWHSSWGKCILT